MRKVAMLSLIIALMVMIAGCATSSQEIYKKEKLNRILNTSKNPYPKKHFINILVE